MPRPVVGGTPAERLPGFVVDTLRGFLRVGVLDQMARYIPRPPPKET